MQAAGDQRHQSHWETEPAALVKPGWDLWKRQMKERRRKHLLIQLLWLTGLLLRSHCDFLNSTCCTNELINEHHIQVSLFKSSTSQWEDELSVGADRSICLEKPTSDVRVTFFSQSHRKQAKHRFYAGCKHWAKQTEMFFWFCCSINYFFHTVFPG